jgi:class 3 adenylate cyclase
MPATSIRTVRAKRLELLVKILTFEVYWAYFVMSSGYLYQRNVKESAIQLISCIEELRPIDTNFQKVERRHSEHDREVMSKLLTELKAWANGTIQTCDYLIQKRAMLWIYFIGIKAYILQRHKIDERPSFSISLEENEHTERYLRWQPHLPKAIMKWNEQSIDIDKLSKTQTVVVFGDIRRSQDLMVYTVGKELYEKMMIKFFDEIRALFNKHYGIIDKFTGDGFLGYFNQYLSQESNKSFIDCFVAFSEECMDKSKVLFDEWKKHVRKMPAEDIMLAIGADIGQIYFGDKQGHLICIGDSIVWAQRMCAEAPASSIYVNNILASQLRERKDVSLTPVKGTTKAGEGFTAFNLLFTKNPHLSRKRTTKKA